MAWSMKRNGAVRRLVIMPMIVVGVLGGLLGTVAFGARSDFNGDNFADLAIGTPAESVENIANAGVVHVLYGAAPGLSTTGAQLWHQDIPGILNVVEPSDSFGTALATGDFNNDGFTDLAVGVPFELAGSIQPGIVQIIYGSAAGLSPAGDQLFHQNVAGIPEVNEDFDLFGQVLASGDFNNDGFADLAIGIPGESVGMKGGAGAVQILYGSAAGLSVTNNQLWHQNTPGVREKSEDGDGFGQALAAGDFNNDGFVDLAIGVPNESRELSEGTLTLAGIVQILYGSASGLSADGDQIFHQGRNGVRETEESFDRFGAVLTSGDFNNDGFADLAIGTPGESIGGIQQAGVVQILYGSVTGLSGAGDQLLHQDVAGVLDVSEGFDRFGNALAAGDFNNDGFADLAIGVAEEDLGTRIDGGVVQIFYGSNNGLKVSNDQRFHQNTAGIADMVEAGDLFGRALTADDFNNDGFADLAIGTPGESLAGFSNAGSVHILYGTAQGLGAANDQRFHQNSPGMPEEIEAFDAFGSALP